MRIRPRHVTTNFEHGDVCSGCGEVTYCSAIHRFVAAARSEVVYHQLKVGVLQFRRVICHVRASECLTSLRYSSILGVAEIGRRL